MPQVNELHWNLLSIKFFIIILFVFTSLNFVSNLLSLNPNKVVSFYFYKTLM